MRIHSRYVSVHGLRTHYLEAGDGRPVVLLHSGEFGGCAEISWEFVIPALSEHYRVIAPDWLGFGRSDKIYDFEQGQARRLAHLRRFLEVMRLEGADIVGNSMGGSLFTRGVAAEPEAYRLRSLSLISSGGFAPDNEHRRALLAYDCTREAMRALVTAMFHDPKWAKDEAYIERRYQMSLVPGAWECTAAPRFRNPAAPARTQFGQADNTPYERIAVPVLIIAGGNDKLREPGYAKNLAAKFHSAELHVLDQCGHCPNIERAADVNRILIDFLARLDRASDKAR